MRISIIAFILIIFLSLLLSSSYSIQQQHEVVVRNIVIPFRVFDGDRFINNLTKDDIELFEDGIPQKIQALYLANKNEIVRAEADVTQVPALSRNFYLLFQLTDYHPQISQVLDYFFNDVFLEKDMVTMMTPLKNYTLSKAAVRSKSKEIIINDSVNVISNDTKKESLEYNNLLNDLKRIVSSITAATRQGERSITSGLESDQSLDSAGGVQLLLPRAMETLNKMENLRMVDEEKIIKFATQLKRQPGRKYVFFFYQREYRPELHPNTLNQLMSTYNNDASIRGQLQDLFTFYHRDISLNTEKIKQAFSDSDILFNFIFLNKQPENVTGIYMKEQSEDVFKIFSDVASATGGTVDSSQNPAAAFKNAAEIADTYYLLYYSPKEYKSDGRFHRVTVMVKGKNYRVTHREGYFAD
jgi:VWFA-related protein